MYRLILDIILLLVIGVLQTASILSVMAFINRLQNWNLPGYRGWKQRLYIALYFLTILFSTISQIFLSRSIH